MMKPLYMSLYKAGTKIFRIFCTREINNIYFIKIMKEDFIIDKEEIIVPNNIRFISEWKGYTLPNGICIIDKGVTGCGYTEYCLTNDNWVVLCSPRKLLLENKAEQHKDDSNILYVKNEIIVKLEEVGIKERAIREFKNTIKSHVYNCINCNKAPKFMITYDSLHYLVEALDEISMLNKFIYVIDEFQSIFLDSYFKAEIEINFILSLKGCENIIYLSATPMLDRYLSKLDEFKFLKFYKLIWKGNQFVDKVKITKKKVRSLSKECEKIIVNYLTENFPKTLSQDGNLIQSKEAVFYFNSVSEIIKIIKTLNLKKEEVNIICSDTIKNRKKISKINHSIGRVPLKGEKNKMFTFCTSTAYIGVDFYSDCAKTYVFASPNVDCLALDISLDLPQIAGRQRNRFNLFKNEIVVFYTVKSEGVLSLSKESFDKLQEERNNNTDLLLDMYNQIKDDPKKKELYVGKLISSIKVDKYSKDFVSVSLLNGRPVKNRLIEIATERSWDVIQDQYLNDINVTRSLQEISNDIKTEYSRESIIVHKFLDEYFNRTNVFHEKMKMYCEFSDLFSKDKDVLDYLNFCIKDPEFSLFYKYYGTKGCSSRKFRKNDLEQGWSNDLKENDVLNEIFKHFSVGKSYTKSYIKETLNNIYSRVGINKKAKAVDLEKYFNLSRVRIKQPNNKLSEGFRLS